ncbi:MAG TPA: hypothetical protein DHV62_07325, partial [Elusimicrobia bacterium]|nr:hypothetical protein [Elusimicrobiota bacterium]
MKLLLLFPNMANWATISTAIPILSGIAKSRCWEVEYFDTYNYEKRVDSSSDKEKAGGFKPGFSLLKGKTKPFSQIKLDLQQRINEFQPDLIAITALSQEYELLLKFFPEIRVPSETKVIIGGIHAILERDGVIETKLFDLVVFSEAEAVFDSILSKIENHKQLGGINGTYFYNRMTKETLRYPKIKLLKPEELWKVKRDFSIFNEIYFIRPFDGKQIRRYDVETARG